MSNRRCISIDNKIKIMGEVDKGTKKKDIAYKYDIPVISLSIILKNYEVNLSNYIDELDKATTK